MRIEAESTTFMNKLKAAPTTAALALLCCWLPGTAQADQGKIPAPTLEKIKAATVYIIYGGLSDDTASIGSGMIISSSGLVLTNAHVLSNPANPGAPGASLPVSVVLHSGQADAQVVPARVICLGNAGAIPGEGTSPLDCDLALLQIPAPKPMPCLALADAGGLSETQSVFAVGYPLGMAEISIREGSISSLRHDPARGIAVIEHTAGLDHGNSGGPLIDAAGNVLGINVLVAGRNVNWAISSLLVGEFLAAAGKADLLSSELLATLRYDEVLTTQLHAPDEAAGLEGGDIWQGYRLHILKQAGFIIRFPDTGYTGNDPPPPFQDVAGGVLTWVGQGQEPVIAVQARIDDAGMQLDRQTFDLFCSLLVGELSKAPNLYAIPIQNERITINEREWNIVETVHSPPGSSPSLHMTTFSTFMNHSVYSIVVCYLNEVTPAIQEFVYPILSSFEFTS